MPRRFEAPECRLLPCVVRVQGENELARQRPKLSYLVLGEGGAHGRHNVLVSMLVRCYRVHVSFDYDRDSGLSDFRVGEVESIKRVALVEDLGLRGVDVLGRRIVESASSESHDVALAVEDGKHQPVPEEVPDLAVVAPSYEACGYRVLFLKPVRPQILDESVPPVGAQSQLELIYRLPTDLPAVQVLSRRPA